MGDFYAYNIRKKRKEKLENFVTGVMVIKGLEKDTSRYFVRGKISDGSDRYVFINEAKYKELKSKGIKDVGSIVKQRKDKKRRSRRKKVSGSGRGRKMSRQGGSRGSKSRSRSGGRSHRRSRSRSRSTSRTGGRHKK